MLKMLELLETAVFYNMVDKQKMLEMLHLQSVTPVRRTIIFDIDKESVSAGL